MDLFLLDGSLRRDTIIDQYESLIWTDRYRDMGDFELLIRNDRNSRALLLAGKRLSIAKSRRVMTIETIETTTSDNGTSMLKINGRSLETILEDRTAKESLVGLTADAKWDFTTTKPMDIARQIFDAMCVNNTYSSGIDKLPFYATGSTYPVSDIVEPADAITVSFDPGTVYGLIKSLADTYNFGFRLYRAGEETPTLRFDVYTGNNRTSSQTQLPAVIFSPDLDNLSNISELSSVAALKNVAYVYAMNGAREVLANPTQPAPTGLDRRVLMVNASDITLPVGTALNNALDVRGARELAAHRAVVGFDGEIPQSGSYEYEKHYFLGDLVETRSEDGLATNMRVTEQIIICDVQGERSYPTLSLDLLITPGTWYGWDANQHWADMTTETWATV